MALNRVLEPIDIGNVRIRNRIARTGHSENLGFVYPSDACTAYHLARARGGCGLTILGGVGVHPSSAGYGALWDDAIVPRLRRFTEALEPHGMKLFQQLWHGGHHYPGMAGEPPPAPGTFPSPSPFSFIPTVGVPMTTADIRAMVTAYAQAAVRCREGGLHGVEINAAHGYLPFQFLSPVTNDREDEYGGSLENRMRFLLEVYEAVRRAVGEDYVVGCRLGATERQRGPQVDDIRTTAHELERRGLDYVSAALGDYWRMETMVGAMHSPTGYQIPSAKAALAGLGIPRIIAGRFRTLDEAEQVLRDGDFEMVGMVRALIADPDLVRKTVEGRAEQVRPCIACNQGCIGGVLRGTGLHCTVNPAAGYEEQYDEEALVRVATPKRVIVVGGGPAGMEAARTAALRGHRVTLFEAAARLGGTVNVAMKAARQTSLGDITQWLEAELYRLGVDVRLNQYVEAEELLREAPDAVIVATGSTPRMDGWQPGNPDAPVSGVHHPHVLSSTDLLMSPPRTLGRTALVLDTVGHFEGVTTAAHLIQSGLAVTYVTSHRAFAPYVRTTDRDDSMLEMLYAGDFTLLIAHLLVAIEPGHCLVRPAMSSRTRSVPADTVVLVTSNAPNRSLHDELAGRVPDLGLVGDALSPRDLQVAILEGHRRARAIS